MDKNAIKKYAVWARRELISRVSQRAALYEITEKGYGDANAVSVLGRVMSADEKAQRGALINQIREKGYEQVMEEIAYTWFNRFIALRFMEVNGYLPSHVRVFTDEENNFKPQILTEAINVDLEGLDMEKVYALKTANDDDTLFKYLIIVQCNALSSILPGMFQRISDYTELLFPDNLLREGSVIEQMISMISEEDWTDQVQIIGWLYQYYNTEPKDKVFADLKKNIKISKENIPAATQLFTPDWIVRYMVENSLGRLWLEGHPNDALRAGWKYYLDEAEQEPDVQKQLAEIRKEYAALKPEDILAIDPCQGSGHILAYMFDVLVQIYESYGYTAREADASIVEHNIWGLDIDDRAAQLAYFSVMMKARQYDRRFFSRGIQPHVYSIRESNNLDPHCIEYFTGDKIELKLVMDTLVKELHDAKEYGSILNVTHVNFETLYSRFDEIRDESVPGIYSYQAIDTLLPFVQVADAMSQKYHVVITNPPYMGNGNMGAVLSDYVKRAYPHSKGDLSTVMMERALLMCQENYFMSMINIPVWMFLTSYEGLRSSLVKNHSFVNMLHLGRGIFGSDFGTTSFVIMRGHVRNFLATYRRLFDKQGAVDSVEEKERWFFSGKGKYLANQDAFSKIPGYPMAYWASKNFIAAFDGTRLGDLCDLAEGIHSRNNDAFLRLWYEVSADKSALFSYSKDKKWYPCNKGGTFRKWYGNNDYVIDWEEDGYNIKHFEKASAGNDRSRFSEGITFTTITSAERTFRYSPHGYLYDMAGPTMYPYNQHHMNYILAVFCSKLGYHFLSAINPGVSLKLGEVKTFPVIIDDAKLSSVSDLSSQCIDICKEDWDSFETSWDFKFHPLLPTYAAEREAVFIDKNGMLGSLSSKAALIEDCYKSWENKCNSRFLRLKENEEMINSIFIKLYGLEAELQPEVSDADITVRKADLQREVRSLISYAVGCMMGRYSLDVDGLIFAGGEWDSTKYRSFIPDHDGILPICDDDYFTDDIVGRFASFVETVYGNETLEENLKFIAGVLGGKGSPRDRIRNYFLNEFYADHCVMCSSSSSGKRPYYWLFDSGKKNGFKCLIYMHRYQPDTIARIRTDYVHEQQSRYRTAIADLESRIAGVGTGERVKLSKQLTKLQEQADELRVYEEKIHHLADQMIKIDLDDGVKANYAKFQDVLAKIK